MARYNAETGPTNAEIVAYWTAHAKEECFAVDWSEAHERCWRCAYKSKLQRCHIVPASRDGAFVPSNVVLLCGRCHRDAPNCTDSRLMWTWMRSTCVPLYETFLVSRGIQEYHRMFGRYPFASLTPEDLTSPLFKQILDEERQETVIHWGEGRRNPATLASIYARTEERFTGKCLVPASQSVDAEVLRSIMFNPAFADLLAILPNT